MQIPTFDFAGTKLVDKEGNATPEFNQFMSQLVQVLLAGAGPEGLVSPSQTAGNIALLTHSSNGTIVYDSTNNAFKGNVSGTFKTFTLT